MHLFEHFNIWNSNGNNYLALNKYDITASTRFILVDATHQQQSRNNYINTLVENCNYYACYDVLIIVNSVSDAILRNIPAGIKVNFVDGAYEEMNNTDGDSFYQFIEFGDDEYRYYNPPLGYCPQFNHICNVEDFYYGLRNQY